MRVIPSAGTDLHSTLDCIAHPHHQRAHDSGQSFPQVHHGSAPDPTGGRCVWLNHSPARPHRPQHLPQLSAASVSAGWSWMRSRRLIQTITFMEHRCSQPRGFVKRQTTVTGAPLASRAIPRSFVTMERPMTEQKTVQSFRLPTLHPPARYVDLTFRLAPSVRVCRPGFTATPEPARPGRHDLRLDGEGLTLHLLHGHRHPSDAHGGTRPDPRRTKDLPDGPFHAGNRSRNRTRGKHRP